MYLERDFAADVYLTEAQKPIPPPLTHCIRVYNTYSHVEGGGGELNQREGERGNSSQSWVENTNMADKHLPQSPFTGQSFQMTFCFGVYTVN